MYETKLDTNVKKVSKSLIEKFVKSVNIAEHLTDEEVSKIGSDVIQGYEIDKNSIGERFDRWERATDLAMQVIEPKSWPFENSSNVKFPLMTTAAIQFNARAYPAILNEGNVVKSKVIGQQLPEKLQAADRASQYMSWQLCEDMEEWEFDTDRLLIMLPILGTMFRKTWFSQIKNRPATKILKPSDLVINANAQSLETAARITERFTMYKNEILSKIRRGTYLDVVIGENDGEEDNAPYDMLEQHCWLDLDDDGYREPYTVTVCETDGKVLQIAPRYTKDDILLNQRREVVEITPTHFYTKYGFVPALDGGFYDVGFCDILYPMNEAVNSVINQLLDAGTLQNTNTGFISSALKMDSGAVRMRMGELTKVKASGNDIRNSIVLQQWPGPSPTLFSLLGALIDAGKDISGIKDVLTGENQGANVPATTTMALIEQGMKVFNAIYKRIHLAVSKELRKLRDLNFMTIDPETYSAVLDGNIRPEDFDPDTYDFYPVSDPTVATDAQRMGKAQYLLQFANDPLFNPVEIRKRAIEAAHIDGVDQLIVPPQPPQGPTPEQTQIMAQLEKLEKDIEARQRELDQKEHDLLRKDRELLIKEHEAAAKIQKTAAETSKIISETEGKHIENHTTVSNLMYPQVTDTQ